VCHHHRSSVVYVSDGKDGQVGKEQLKDFKVVKKQLDDIDAWFDWLDARLDVLGIVIASICPALQKTIANPKSKADVMPGSMSS
jgi:hypothetical protein